ncbi:DISARM system phospholipase D-like protein DrmC [Photobacterium sanguinicancri]|uniref:DISARM system phospholipase D-like protein DrmC n=1 Tax=Photobacterium sanguinicancri TaxID=875932 RepID=UPI0026E1E583|nr:DISARM system phospholipase D-like protein DrmC [Photobacterium sanguinicancri]MDO6497740.1 DISARM system phospholipase D-like protein DrmC [Photobacterium sanguinicancri]
MDDLLKGIYDVVKDQHFSKIKTLSKKFKNTSKENRSTLKGFFNVDSSNNALNTLLNLWGSSNCSSDELASLLLGASYGCTSKSKNESTELVWTGPDANLFPVRRSEQVLLDIINSAQETLFIVSFVLVNIPKVEAAIEKAVRRGVDVKMLLESEDKEASNSFIDTIKRLHTTIPEIQLYIWPRENRESTQGGFARVHAKCAVADKRLAFITSANLTAAALDKNIEMGINIEGGSIPESILSQLHSMINSKEITRYTPTSLTDNSISISTSTICLENFPDSLKAGESAYVEFDNQKTGLKDTRNFIKCDVNEEKSKAGTLVIIKHEGKLLLGNYRWNKQQSVDDGRQYYVVTIKGFGPTEKIIIDENDWSNFKPLAMEITN